MFSDVHTEFILTPLMEILSDGVNACAPLPVGIENSALGEYFLQSLFLRMTGAQEQKMKCICWVLATNDYRYRYEFLNIKKYGECSAYSDKKDIYKDISSLIHGLDNSFSPISILDSVPLPEGRETEIESNWKNSINSRRNNEAAKIIAQKEADGTKLTDEAKDRIQTSIFNKPYPLEELDSLIYAEKKSMFVRNIASRLEALLENSPLTSWDPRGYQFFKEHYIDVLSKKQLILTENEFLGNQLQEYYKQIVYDHRNRTAHNTMSYQKDIPTLSTLSDQSFVYKNYFYRFAILILIDEVFMMLFKKYRELAGESA